MYSILFLVGVFGHINYVTCVGSSSSSSVYFSELSCDADEYTCRYSGECIPSLWVCDRDADCYDSSDETECPLDTSETTTELPMYYFTEEIWRSCEPGEFTCDSGQCILSGQACNYWEDCDDGSDERNCYRGDITPNPTEAYQCANNEYKCQSWPTHCIPKHWICDIYIDCLDGSDEVGCPSQPPIQYGTPVGGDYFTTIEPGPCYPDPCGQWGICKTNYFISAYADSGFKCDCFKGHTGQFCEIDLCDQLRCRNNGLCKISWWTGDAYCDCLDRYSGERCEEDRCNDVSCQNNGQCKVAWITKRPYCDCSPGYSGTYCETDACASVTCRNGGECKVAWPWTDEPYCDCSEGYGGKECEKELCTNLQCQNNGKCEISWWSRRPYCDCEGGYIGKHCEIDLCSSINCQNNGLCELTWLRKKPYCDCTDGYSGEYCEIENSCGSLNCQNNGVCEVSWLNNAYCDCTKGYSGENCEKDLCGDLQCYNNGTCELPWLRNTPYCDCSDGYTGDNCEHDCSTSWKRGCKLLG
ncbi:uncharacterized protein [Antedon mediterranea]|uniref:uncharacterized protein n=1 Tax=Antedon mediterranea TaxID=105859 RepID=UPI003AF6D229